MFQQLPSDVKTLTSIVAMLEAPHPGVLGVVLGVRVGEVLDQTAGGAPGRSLRPRAAGTGRRRRGRDGELNEDEDVRGTGSSSKKGIQWSQCLLETSV